VGRYKHFIPVNVLDEARARINHVFDTFDSVVVSFSGGKDSLAVLHLVRAIAEARDRLPVRAVFRDEELIHPCIVDFVETYRHHDWCDLQWWAVPLESHGYLLGSKFPLTQWDPERGPDQWARPKPEWALDLEDFGLPPDTVLSQHTADDLACRGLPGKVAIFTGIRADESLTRYRSCVSKMKENYIVSSSTPQAMQVKPIYDWHENDVFRFFYDEGIEYAPIYRTQNWVGRPLRVSSGTPAETSKYMHLLKAYDPDLFAMMARVFPHIEVQARYGADYSPAAMVEKYGNSWGGIANYIRDRIPDPKQRSIAVAELRRVRQAARQMPDSYPLGYVLRCFIGTAGSRHIQAQSKESLQAARDSYAKRQKRRSERGQS